MKKRTKTKGWTAKRREEQRQRCLSQKPWEHSTGPKTEEGKSVSSQNARTHGRCDAGIIAISKILSAQARFLDKVMKEQGIKDIRKII